MIHQLSPTMQKVYTSCHLHPMSWINTRTKAKMKQWQPLLHVAGRITCPNPEPWRLLKALNNTHLHLLLQGISPREIIQNAGKCFMPSPGRVGQLVEAFSHTLRSYGFQSQIGVHVKATHWCFSLSMMYLYKNQRTYPLVRLKKKRFMPSNKYI